MTCYVYLKAAQVIHCVQAWICIHGVGEMWVEEAGCVLITRKMNRGTWEAQACCRGREQCGWMMDDQSIRRRKIYCGLKECGDTMSWMILTF